MTNDKYNGCTNYETWVVNLWMSNDQGTYEHYNECTRELMVDYEGSELTSALATMIRENHEELASELLDPVGVFADLLGSSLDSVNWMEIARHLVDSVREDMEVA